MEFQEEYEMFLLNSELIEEKKADDQENLVKNVEKYDSVMKELKFLNIIIMN